MGVHFPSKHGWWRGAYSLQLMLIATQSLLAVIQSRQHEHSHKVIRSHYPAEVACQTCRLIGLYRHGADGHLRYERCLGSIATTGWNGLSGCLAWAGRSGQNAWNATHERPG